VHVQVDVGAGWRHPELERDDATAAAIDRETAAELRGP
jgi:hypothetical protein